MFVALNKLNPGQQGGGAREAKKKKRDTASSSSTFGPAPWSASQQTSNSRPRNTLEAAIKQQHALAQAEARGRKLSRQLPDWIAVGQRVGYLSSSGRVCEGIIDDVSVAKLEVRFVFAANQEIWKRVPFDLIFSKGNPLRRLSLPGARSRSMTELLDTAQRSEVDKAIMLERIVGNVENEALPDGAENVSRPASVAPEPGSAPGSACSRSRSRSPRATPAEARGSNQCQELPSWIAVGQRVGYVSQSSGRSCEVDISMISTNTKEVKIVFVEDCNVWKRIPFSMILSDRNPLKPNAAQHLKQSDCIGVSP